MKNDWIRDMQPIRLHEPVFDVCVTVFETLKMKRTSRVISSEKISMQILSDILWAGTNDPHPPD